MPSYKSGRVVILDGLCIAEGLQYGISLQELFFQFPLTEETVSEPPTKSQAECEFRQTLPGFERLMKHSLC